MTTTKQTHQPEPKTPPTPPNAPSTSGHPNAPKTPHSSSSTAQVDGWADLSLMPSQWLATETLTLTRHLATDTYALLRLIGEIDARGAHAMWGALSCAAWLADAGDIELSTAHRQVRVARSMRTFPCLDAAMAAGDISFAKARILTPHLAHDNATDLVEIARTHPVGRLGVAVAAWLHRHDDPDAIADRQHRERSVSWHTDPDGMITLTARLEPAVGGAVCAVINQHLHPTTTADTARADQTAGTPSRETLARQRADTLARLITTHTPAHGPGDTDDADLDRPVGRVDTELVIHITADGNHLTDGTPIGDHAVTRLLPGAFISLLLDDGERHPIDASPRRRFPTRRQRRVIDATQHHCQQPGCQATIFLE